MFCSSCGKKINVNAQFCENCGQKVLKYSDQKDIKNENDRSEENDQMSSVDMNESEIIDPLNLEDETNATRDENIYHFVGKNYDYYHSKWKMIDENQNSVSWNIAALFLSVFWLGYRKMYKIIFFIAIFFLLFDLTLYFIYSIYDISDFFRTLDNGLTVAMSVVFGMYGNYFYKKHTEKQILIAQNTIQDHEHQKISLARKGGTSIGGIFTSLAILILVYGVPATFIPFPVNTIESIKSGAFYEYPDVSVEDLFETVFFNPHWKELEGTSENGYVEFTGTIYEYETNFLVQINFFYNYDTDEFEIYQLEIDGEPLSDEELPEFLEYLFFMYENDHF